MLGHMQEWGQDEVRFLSMRGWVIVRKKKELQEEINDLESSLIRNQRSFPPHVTNKLKV